MTYSEFLQRLAETPRDWRLDALGYLRQSYQGLEFCPIEVCGQHSPVSHASAALSLSPHDQERIMDAADNHAHCDLSVRADLLRACGLET